MSAPPRDRLNPRGLRNRFQWVWPVLSLLDLFRESASIAFAAIKANKVRSSLTLMGIVIGVAAVVGVASVLTGLDVAVERSIAELGPSNVVLTRNRTTVHVGGRPSYNDPRITVEDAAAVRRFCPRVASASAVCALTRSVSWRGQRTKSVAILGVEAHHLDIAPATIAEGRFFTRSEALNASRVCVIGSDVAETLFGSVSPLGFTVGIDERPFRVIGVLAERERTLAENPNETVFIPLGAAQAMRGWTKEVNYVLIKPRSVAEVDAALDEVESLMRRRRGLKAEDENNFGVATTAAILQMYKDITRGTYAAMILISSIALLVGGIGIMNMMLVSVKERTREIGIRRAVGARRLHILAQFLAEAVTLTVSGGAVGIAVGVGFALLLSALTPIPAAVNVAMVVVSILVSLAVGLFFGLFPAARAAAQDPIEALRYE